MIYQNNRINKKYVEIKNIHLDLSENGIYLIKGRNGCGKTTLMEYILFDENESHFIFDSQEERQTFSKSRYNLFAYVSQKIIYSELSVDKYIRKMNSKINMEDVYEYLQVFEMSKEILDKKFHLLSGGEQMKISIITALLKKTPYVFMDEPTNYMDNGSIKVLLKIIEKEALNRKFIIVSHDPRLDLKSFKEYVWREGSLSLQKEELKSSREKIITHNPLPVNSKLNICKVFMELNKKYSYLITFYVMLLFLAGMLTYTNLAFSNSIGEINSNYHDSILVYFTGGGHDPLNMEYEDAEKLTVKESLYDVYIDYEAIPEIAEDDRVKAIYMLDLVYTEEILNKAISGYSEGEISIYSCPDKYYNQYGDTFRDDLMLTYTEGKLPTDGNSEVAISKEMLISIFGYEEDQVDEAIGDNILIMGKEYEIVGFSYLDVALVSYENNNNYGYYCYNKDTYLEYMQKQMNYIEEKDCDDAVKDILIEVDEKNERAVLNSLVQNYPSNCYISDYFQKAFIRNQEITVFLKFMVFHVGISMIFAAIIWMIVRKSIKYNMSLIWDIGNYYVNRRNMMNWYVIILCAQYAVLGLLCAFANSMISKHGYLTGWFIAVDCLIIIVPIFISCRKAYNEVNK